MSRYKCEYYVIGKEEKQVSLMVERDQFFDILDIYNVDYSKDIKIFEKIDDWKLAYHIIDGKRVFKEFSDDEKKRAEARDLALRQQENIDRLCRLITSTNICETRKENQNFFDIILDGFFFGEDISKPKLNVLNTSK